MVRERGLDCISRFAGNQGCCQFLNWQPQMSTGHLHFNGFESPSNQKAGIPRGYPSFLVRERGLEPPRDYHTHLKRACLPFQHSRKCLDIVSYFPCFVNPFLRNGPVGFPGNRVAVSGNRLPFISGFPLLRKQGIHNGRNHTAVGDEHRIPIQELRKRP